MTFPVILNQTEWNSGRFTEWNPGRFLLTRKEQVALTVWCSGRDNACRAGTIKKNLATLAMAWKFFKDMEDTLSVRVSLHHIRWKYRSMSRFHIFRRIYTCTWISHHYFTRDKHLDVTLLHYNYIRVSYCYTRSIPSTMMSYTWISHYYSRSIPGSHIITLDLLLEVTSNTRFNLDFTLLH